MKGIAILVLVGLSLFSNGYCLNIGSENDDDMIGQILKPIPCLIDSLTGSVDLTLNCLELICKYGNIKNLDTKLVEEFGKDVKVLLKKAKCATADVTEILKLSMLENLETAAACIPTCLGELGKCLDFFGVLGSFRDSLCSAIDVKSITKCVTGLVENPLGLLNVKCGCEAGDVDKVKQGLGHLNCKVIEDLKSLGPVLSGVAKGLLDNCYLKLGENMVQTIMKLGLLEGTLKSLSCVVKLGGGLGGGLGLGLGGGVLG